MVYILLNLAFAVIPALLLLSYFYRKDKLKPEPKNLVLKSFAFGLFAVVPALLMELLLSLFMGKLSGILYLLFKSFILAGLIEESAKMLSVKFYVYNKPDFDEITDGIVYTIAASMGFAILENILYLFSPSWTLLVRGLTAVPLHCVASGIMGYYIGLSKFNRKVSIGKGLFFAVLIHGFYDFFLFTGTVLALLVIPLLVVCGFILLRLFRKAQEADASHRWGFI